MAAKTSRYVPPDLRARLEQARLDTLALMRTLDRLHLADSLVEHPTFRTMFELDADCAEALCVMNRPATFKIDWRAMVRDTEVSLRKLPAAREAVRATLDPHRRAMLAQFEGTTRAALDPAEAYNLVPST